MCVAIAQKKGAKTLTEAQLENGWTANPDGGGYAYIHPETNEIVVRKYLEEKDFTDAYIKEHEEFGDQSPFIVHMRIETHGGVSVETTHPFRVDRGEGMMAFAHNGIISAVNSLTQTGISDTMAFSEWILADLPDGWLDNGAIKELVEDYIGSSKLVFLTTEPAAEHQQYILNEDLGHWSEDTWFSNHSCDYVTAKGWYVGQRGTNYSQWWNDEEEDDLSGLFTIPQKTLPAKSSMLPRFMVNKEILKDGLVAVGEEAKKQGYCPDCLYKPCQCKETCYYCNRDYGTCKCEYWITIDEMKQWCGAAGFDKMREEDITMFEIEREATVA